MTAARVYRFGAGALGELPAIAAELGLERLMLVTTKRGRAAAGRLGALAGTFDAVRSHVPVESVRVAASQALELGADGLVGFGGGSAIDTCKAVAAELLARGKDAPGIIAVPTTYAGAEWTPFYGLRLQPGRKGGGADDRVRPVAALYDPLLTLDLPLAATVGTALNALAHCAEAYYSPRRSDRGDRHADCGATAIGYALPLVADRPRALYGRTRLLEGAMRAAMALGDTGLCLGHAMAQALGGRYDLPQGAMNAICLPVAIRYNEPAAPAAVARFGRALNAADAAMAVEDLAALGGFPLRLRDHGVPEGELPEVAAVAAARPGARANPRPVTAEVVEALLRSVW